MSRGYNSPANREKFEDVDDTSEEISSPRQLVSPEIRSTIYNVSSQKHDDVRQKIFIHKTREDSSQLIFTTDATPVKKLGMHKNFVDGVPNDSLLDLLMGSSPNSVAKFSQSPYKYNASLQQMDKTAYKKAYSRHTLTKWPQGTDLSDSKIKKGTIEYKPYENSCSYIPKSKSSGDVSFKHKETYDIFRPELINTGRHTIQAPIKNAPDKKSPWADNKLGVAAVDYDKSSPSGNLKPKDFSVLSSPNTNKDCLPPLSPKGTESKLPALYSQQSIYNTSCAYLDNGQIPNFYRSLDGEIRLDDME